MLCEQCPNKIHIRTQVLPENNLKAKYVIIGEAPWKTEFIQKKYFVGEAGRLLWRVLEHMDFKRKDFHIDNIVKCMVKDPTETMINCCKPTLFDTLESMPNKKLILLLGGVAFEVFDLDHRGIVYNSGRVFWSDRFDCAILPCIHPASVLYDKKKEELFNLSISFMLYARITIETFGSLKVLSNEESKELRLAKQKLKDTQWGKELFSHRGETIYANQETTEND